MSKTGSNAAGKRGRLSESDELQAGPDIPAPPALSSSHGVCTIRADRRTMKRGLVVAVLDARLKWTALDCRRFNVHRRPIKGASLRI
jgi:hypothetical protein